MDNSNIASALRCVAVACCALSTPVLLSAQTAANVDHGFTTMAPRGASIEVVESAGNRTRGRMLREDAESFTIRRGGREIRFDRQQVAEVYQRGDSLKSGLVTGLGVGAALGLIGGLSIDDCGALFTPHPCSGRERAANAAVAGGFLGALGMGIGVGLDALFSARRLVYYQQEPGVAAISLAPIVSRRAAGLVVAAKW